MAPQAQVRYAAKLRFLMGLTKRLCEITGHDANPAVQIMLGRDGSFATIVDCMLQAQETQATVDAEGVVWPAKGSVYAVMPCSRRFNPRLLNIAGIGGAPSSCCPPRSGFRQSGNPRDLSAISPRPAPSRRDAILSWFWTIGSEFAGRHEHMRSSLAGRRS